MFRKKFSVFVMFGQNKFVQSICGTRSWNNFKNISTAIIENNNSGIRWDVIVPKSVDVVEKTQISRHQNRLVFIAHRKSHRSGSGAVDSACSSVAIDFVFVEVEKLRITNCGRIAEMKIDIFRQFIRKRFKKFEIWK